MSVGPQSAHRLGDYDPEACAVCGSAVEDEGDIEDSNGWRWFSDGQGGLLPLCPTCPVPTDIASAYYEEAHRKLRDTWPLN
jgi:hypothetical protein